MTGSYEGDLVRPLGLVIVYASYAEGELDELLNVLPAREPFDEAKRKWTVGRKLVYAQKLVRQLRADTLADLSASLKEAKVLFEKRNALVHGQILSGGRVVSNRTTVPNQRVSPEDLLQLAEKIFGWKEHLYVHRCRHLLPLLAALERAK